jgi:hypothetical protein
VTLPALALTSCAATDVDADALVGIWRTTVWDWEGSLRLSADGTFDVVDAELDALVCTTESGTWQTTANMLTTTTTIEHGNPVAIIDEAVFNLSGSTLTLDWIDDDPETYTRVNEMLDCASYGWPK